MVDLAVRVRGIGVFVGVLVGFLLAAQPAQADLKVAAGGSERTVDANLEIQPDASGDPFFQQLQDCLDELKAAGKDGLLVDLVGSSHEHKVVKTSGGSTCTWDDSAGAKQDGSGNAGAGSDTTTRWNPTNGAFPDGYPDGSPRDPCGALLHELVHAHDADNGLITFEKMDTNSDTPPDRVLIAEVRACRLQNWFHQWKGISSRTKYGSNALPLGVRFDRCPDCVDLFLAGGLTASAPDLYYEVPLENVAGTNNEDFDVPGKTIEIRDAGNVLCGTVTLIKTLDGKVKIRLECVEGKDLSLTDIQFKNDGQPLGAVIMLDDPLECSPSTPSVVSDPIEVPGVPALRILKHPDGQEVTKGDSITFKITVENIGTKDLENVMVTDNPFASCNFNLAGLAVGEKVTRECTVTPENAGSFVNNASASGGVVGGGNVGPANDASDYVVKEP